MKSVGKGFKPKFDDAPSLVKQIDMEVAPPGWENVIKKMKGQPGIDNPYALAYWMKNRGIMPKSAKKKADEAQALPFDKEPLKPFHKPAPTDDKQTPYYKEGATFDRNSPPKDYPKDTGKYADPKNYKYPVNNAKRVRSAISYFSNPDNRKGYTADEVKSIWGRINKAAKKFGIQRSDNSEAVTFSSFGQLLRKQHKKESLAPPSKSGVKLSSEVSLREAKVQDSDKRKIQVIIMSEGLGNKRDMHYYSKDCIRSAAPLFEGSRCFVDHPTETEEITRPERTLRDLVGYYTDVAPSEDGSQLLGTLNLEDTEAGQQWFDKIKSAIDYGQRYPDKVYFAISINADGKTHEEERDGEKINVVDAITGVDSADLVTRPALQTKFVKIMQSMREAAKSGDARRIYLMESRVKQAYAAEAKRLLKMAAEAEGGNPQHLSDLKKGLEQMHAAISDGEHTMNADTQATLKRAIKACDAADDDDGLNTVFKHVKNFVDKVGNDKNDDKDGDQTMAKKKSSEDEDEKKTSEAEDEDEDASEAEDEDEAKFKKAKKAAEAKRKTSEDEDEDEDEDASEAEDDAPSDGSNIPATEARLKKAESKLKKAFKMAMKQAKGKADEAEDGGDPDGVSQWIDLVRKAHSDLYPSKSSEAYASEDEDEDEGKKKAGEARKKSSESIRRVAVNSLRETAAGKLATSAKLDRFYETQTQKVIDRARDKNFIENQAKAEAKILMKTAHMLLQESSLLPAQYPVVMNQLLECSTEREMTKLIESYEAFNAAADTDRVVESYTRVEGAGGRREVRESDDQAKLARLLNGVVKELA